MREMKDSGIEWIGEIPKDWNCCKQKYAMKMLNGRAYSEQEFEHNGKYKILRVGNLTTNSTWYTSSMELPPQKYCKNGDLLYSWSMSYLPIIWRGEKVIYHYHIWKVITFPCIDKKFTYYYLYSLTDALKSEIHKTTMGFITMNVMNNSYIAVPILLEQKKIADFLDGRCTEIDGIVEDINKEIETLEEYKKSVITEAVIKGLNPDVEMKEVANIWFNIIPKTWILKKIKYLFTIKKDIAGESGHTILSITQKGIVPKDISNNEGQIASDYSKYQLVTKGDFAMNHMDLLTGWVDISKYNGVTSPDYRVFSLNDRNKYNSRYYLYLMQICYTNHIFYSLGRGVSNMGRWRLQTNNFLNFFVPVPPLQEQQQIADYLDTKCSEIDSIIELKKEQLETLAEYKKSLIYEYVTGKKEVI